MFLGCFFRSNLTRNCIYILKITTGYQVYLLLSIDNITCQKIPQEFHTKQIKTSNFSKYLRSFRGILLLQKLLLEASLFRLENSNSPTFSNFVLLTKFINKIAKIIKTWKNLIFSSNLCQFKALSSQETAIFSKETT